TSNTFFIMSTTTISVRGNLTTRDDIPYTKYFELCSYENWSLHHYVSLILDNYKFAEKETAHLLFYNTLLSISDSLCISQEIRETVQKLLKNKKILVPIRMTSRNYGSIEMDAFVRMANKHHGTDTEKVNSLWRKAGKARKMSPPPIDPVITISSSKKQRIVPDISRFCPDAEVPLQANGSVDVFEVVKSTVRIFDSKTIALGSSRSYKRSNHLLVDSKPNVKVPRESTYDAEMYRILVNWLVKVHGFEVTGQWHLKQVCEDGDFHHFYCDLTIKNADVPNPVAVIEVLASGSVPKIKKHFDQVLKYADQLCPEEVWIVHFSREDSVVSDPYWPSEKLQDRGLNVIHFWHDE
ncbi:5027_t:CDS:2, partial [Racocetra persica]